MTTIFAEVQDLYGLAEGKRVSCVASTYLDGFVSRLEPFQGMEERLIGSAIRHPDKTVYALFAPARHHHVIQFMHVYFKAAGMANTGDQGFFTSRGRYVSREEGLQIALAQNQLNKPASEVFTLFSEDLW